MFEKRIYENEGLVYLRWVARVLSLAVVLLLLSFTIGEGIDLSVVGPKEWVGLLFFPFGLIVGLLISWRNEGLGGAISLISLAAFYFIYGFILNGSLWQGWAFLLFAVPSILFLVYWFFLPKEVTRFRHI